MDSLLERTEPAKLLLGLSISALLIVIVLVMYLLWPQFQQYREYVASRAVLQEAAPGNSGLSVQLEQAREEVAALSRQLHGDMVGLPARQMEAFIIGRLQTISWDNGVRLVSVKPGSGERIQDFQERLFDIQLHARYSDFYRWLKVIGNDLGFTVVNKYHISPREAKESDPELNINLTIVSYHMVSE